MAENETVKAESEPRYRKSAQWFAIAVVLLLSLVLMIDTFRRAGRDKKEAQPLPIDQMEESRQSELDFQKRLEQEIKRRQEQQSRQPDTQLSQRQVDFKQAPDALAAGQEKEPSIFDEWQKNETKRALEARQSGFQIKKPSSRDRRVQTTSYQPTAEVKDTNLILDQEQKRVMAEIERLERLQQGGEAELQEGRAPVMQQGSLSFQAPVQSQEEAIDVGRPRSEAEPMAGQKLIATGTVIGAVLDQELMSDYIGPFRALVTHDVYDVSNSYIIIPKGSRVIGRSLRITNVNEPIQARMGLVVRWLVLPNGKRISFERRVAALDQAGVPAIKDKVDYHFIAQFLGVAAYAVLASSTSYQGSGIAKDTDFEGQLGQSLREQYAPLAAKYLNLVPTITLEEGTPLKIFIEDDIYAFPWDTISNRIFRVNRASY